MDFIDYLDSRPIYQQIADRYKQLILTGVMLPDEQLPSVRKLAMELSTNPNTVQKHTPRWNGRDTFTASRAGGISSGPMKR